MQKYVIALYIRLSIEDYKYDSLSIENQSLVLHEYAASMPEALSAEIMEAIKQDRQWHDFFYLEITTGLRRGELCGLMWSDFDEKKGTLSIRRTLHGKRGGGYYVGDTKTGKGRRIIRLPADAQNLCRCTRCR